jgi:cysteine-rich repeat protein
VCATDPTCCEVTWTAACAALASTAPACIPCCQGLCQYDCSYCGDGVLNVGELCDDGNQIFGDGCEGCVPAQPASAGDTDLDGTPDALDTCPLSYNPGNGTALFDQPLLALGPTALGWAWPSNVVWVCGRLDHLHEYGVLEQSAATGATSIETLEVPAPGYGLYWLVRPDCPQSSWSSGGTGEILGARDGALP